MDQEETQGSSPIMVGSALLISMAWDTAEFNSRDIIATFRDHHRLAKHLRHINTRVMEQVETLMSSKTMEDPEWSTTIELQETLFFKIL
jgi:hypothetical protein